MPVCVLVLQGQQDNRPTSFVVYAPSCTCADLHSQCALCLLLIALQGQHDNRPNSFLVYAPSRTCAVYGPSEWADPEADRKPAGVPGLGVKELGPYYEY